MLVWRVCKTVVDAYFSEICTKDSMKKFGLLSFLITLAACASATHQTEVNVSNSTELREKIKKSTAQDTSFIAEARLIYFKKSKRLKGSATIVARQPGHLRYEILGPHGGVIEAFATNGKELQIAKLAENRFLYGPASPELLDRLLPFAPLNLDSTGWVELLFGRVTIPEDAALRHVSEKQHYRFDFNRAGTQISVTVDSKTSRMMRITGHVAGERQYDVQVSRWAPEGIPKKLRIVVPKVELEVRMEFRDIQMGTSLDDGLFTLEPIRGIPTEYLGY